MRKKVPHSARFLFHDARRLLLALMFLIPGHTFSQELASADKVEREKTSNQNQSNLRPLKEALKELEAKFEVHFGFEGQKIEDKLVDKKLVEDQQNNGLEKTLNSLLQPLNLKHEKLNGNNYVIYSQERKELKQVESNHLNSIEDDGLPRRLIENLQQKGYDLLVKQDIIVSGKVTSEENEPIPGVNVLIKGTSIGTVTDIEGDYAIDAPEDGTLVFSFIGYTSEEIPVNSRSVIDVALAEDIQSLDEVVVVGYGTQRKSDLTGSVGSVNMTQLIGEVKGTNALQALEGQLAGVQIKRAMGSDPGRAPHVQIRGVGSISAGGTPLYVIDGFPMDNMDHVNPKDIQTIDVLKDASATAIYGSRGSNGVVIITTKRGEDGKARINFETFFGWQKLSKRPDLMDVMTQARYYYDGMYWQNYDAGHDVSGDPASWFYRVPQTVLDVIEGENTTNFDMLDEITQTALTKNYQLSASGGNESIKYFISGQYLNQEGIIINTPFERYSLRANLDGQLTERLKMELNFATSYSEKHGPDATGGGRANGIVGQATSWQLWYPGYNEDGSYKVGYGWDASNNRDNPLASLKETQAKDQMLRVVGNLNTHFQISDPLTLSVLLGATTYNNHGFSFRPEMEVFQAIADGRDDRSSSLNWLSETILNYKNSFNKHNVSGLIGFTTQKETRNWNNIRSRDYINNYVYTLNAVNNKVLTASSEESAWSMVSYLSRINYNYDNKYYFTGSIRADGSSRFGKNRKYGYFPSVALAWRITEEDFLSNSRFLDDLKIRASYGETGNNNIGDYAHISTVNYASAVLGGSKAVGYYPERFPNDNLTWEYQKSLNTGIDAEFFAGRIATSVDYFYTRNYNLLLNVNVPLITGYSNSLQNIGEIENQGLEFSINTRNLVGDFSWTTDFNISGSRNKVLKLGPEGDPIITNSRSITMIGEPMGMFYGYKTDGIFLNQTELENGPTYNPGFTDESRMGDIRFVDVSGPGGVPDGIINSYDRTIIGTPYPDFYYGMTNRFQYKNISLSFNLRGNVGNEIMSSNDFFLYTRARYRQYISESNWWKSPEDQGNGITPKPNNNPTGGNRQVSDRLIDSGTFLRISNINLGYEFPDKIVQKLSISSLSVYINATNPVLFTKNRSFNPEISSNSGNSLSPGIDGDDYPVAKGIIIGLNLIF